MLMAIAFLLGTIAYNSMRQEQNPDVSFGTVMVITAYPGAGPDDINQLITRPVEEAVSSVNGIREVTSTSVEGMSTVTISLEIGVNNDVAADDVRSKVESVTGSLPKDATKPEVLKFDNSASPILTLAFSSSTLNSKQLRDLMDDKLTDRYSQIPGVASASVDGGDEREIQVQISKDKLLAYGVGITDIQRAIANAGLNAPSGRLVVGPQEYSVRVKGDFTDPSELPKLMIPITDPTNPGVTKNVRLGDIAQVEDTVVERTTYSRLNGLDTILLTVQKSRDGNAVEITRAADAVTSQIEKEYSAQGIHVLKTFEEAKQITDSLSDLRFSLFFGVLLVATIVFVFLHNFRGTLIVALAIPTSIFATFVVMALAGFTINNMSMLSLSLAIGVLVDDAIVILENIYRHLKLGEDPRDAAINGRAEIGLAALAISLADVVVFLPVGFMGGIIGQFFKPLALGFVIAVLFSLFVSFTLTPLLASRWYRAGEDLEHPHGWFATTFERGFGRLENRYRRALEWALNHRWFVFITGNVVLIAVFMFIGGSFVPAAAGIQAAAGMGMTPLMYSLYIGVTLVIVNSIRKRKLLLKYLPYALAFGLVFPIAAIAGSQIAGWKKEALFKFQFLPNSDSGQVSANIELPPNASLEATQRVVSNIEQKFMADPDVKYVVSSVGSQSGGFTGANSGSNYAQVSATLYDRAAFLDRFRHQTERLRYRSADSVSADLIQRVGYVPGASVNISSSNGVGFGSPIQLGFTSDDQELLLKTAATVRRRLAGGEIPGVINPDLNSKPGKPELRVIPDRVALADMGIDTLTLGNAVRTLYQGNDDTKLRVLGREYPIRVMMSLKDRNDPDLLTTVPLAFRQGNPIFLGSVASVSSAPGISRITRRNRATEIMVTADLLPGFAAGTVNQQIVGWLQKNKLVPPGVNFKPLGQADFQAREGGFIFGALGIGLVLVYMLLASLYDNLLYPFIIQIAQPQAMVGALLALIITDKPLNLVGMIGIICLVGLVGKNAILVVDYTNTLRDRGRNRHDALVEAGPTRLRPILMTTMALIMGMLPVALALGRGSEFRETIGISIIGGISLSTLLTLLVIPCSYTIFDDMSIGIGKGMSRMRGALTRRPPAATVTPEEEQEPERVEV